MWGESDLRIPKSHPRYESLVTRERLVEGFKKGIVVPQGLIAHGRGEAFDYLLGERTVPPAEKAIKAAASLLLLSERPVISVNGNLAALCPEYVVELSDLIGAKIEVNLFHWSSERARRIAEHLREFGAKEVLGLGCKEKIKGLESYRGLVDPKGIGSADTVLVSIEDGDRTEFLKKSGKRVIAIDLNPLSRTSLAADITIVDNVVRALPKIIEEVKKMRGLSRNELSAFLDEFDNFGELRECLEIIKKRAMEVPQNE